MEYASYNSILLIPILIGLKKYTYQREKSIGMITSIFLFAMSSILYGILLKGQNDICNMELPLVYMVKQFNNLYPYFYGIVIISAIYTSAIASGYGFVANCSKNRKTYQMICGILCITAIPISKIGFAPLVNLLYPVFGMLGLVQIVYIILKNKGLEKKRKN